MLVNIPIEYKTFTVGGITVLGKATTYNYNTVTGSCYTIFAFKLEEEQDRRVMVEYTNEAKSKTIWTPYLSTSEYKEFNNTYIDEWGFVYSYADSDGVFHPSATFTVYQEAPITGKDKSIGTITWSINLPAIDKSSPTLDSVSIAITKGSKDYYLDSVKFTVSHSSYPMSIYGQLQYLIEDGTKQTTFLMQKIPTDDKTYSYDSDEDTNYPTKGIFSGTFLFQTGTYVKLILTIQVDNGSAVQTLEFTKQIPDIPTSVTVSSFADMAVGDTATVTYTLNHHQYATNDFDDSSVTIDIGNEDVLSLSGTTITALAIGSSSVTVTSNSNTSASGSASAFVSDGTFPVFDDYYEILDKNLTDKIIYGCVYLQNSIGATDYEDVTFDGYAHDVRTIYELITSIISNIKALATASSSSADVDITFSRKNTSTNWLTAINKMIDAIQVMQTEQGL